MNDTIITNYMANAIAYKDKTVAVGDTISVSYLIKEGNKERQQLFEGILIKIRGNEDATRMITIRKISNAGIGIERIVPLNSPFIKDIKLKKKSTYTKAKLYFLQGLSGQKLRHKIYRGSK